MEENKRYLIKKTSPTTEFLFYLTEDIIPLDWSGNICLYPGYELKCSLDFREDSKILVFDMFYTDEEIKSREFISVEYVLTLVDEFQLIEKPEIFFRKHKINVLEAIILYLKAESIED
jgi:hypothetical protein